MINHLCGGGLSLSAVAWFCPDTVYLSLTKGKWGGGRAEAMRLMVELQESLKIVVYPNGVPDNDTL